MRQKHKNILPGFFTDDENETKTPKIVRIFREEYKRLDEYLQKYPEITELAHRDLMKLCKPNPKRNRTPDFTTENLFRGVLVMQVEAVPYREAVVRIAPESNTGQTLQNFCRLDKRETINHSLLAVAFKTISPQTWESINDFFALSMKKAKKINVDNIRTDTTVVETNIHYPADSSLLWDTYRTIDRLWTKTLDLGFGFLFPDFRFHPKKIRDLHLDITRFVTSKDRQRKILVKNSYKTLIERTGEAVTKAKRIAAILLASGNAIATSIGVELSTFFPAMDKVVDAAQRRYDGEKVPVEDKVFSIFESHTELIQRGKRDKPIEFGDLPSRRLELPLRCNNPLHVVPLAQLQRPAEAG